MSKYKNQVSLKLAGFNKEDNFEAAKKLLIQHIRKQPNDYWLQSLKSTLADSGEER